MALKTDSLAQAVPYATHLWTAHVEVGQHQTLGQNKNGTRYLIPILGGSFTGAAGFETLSGTVISGGADRQLIRPDGVKELDALYDMRLSDGPIITVRNRVIVDKSRQPDRYAMSVLTATVEAGIHDWLNRRMIIGTLDSLRPNQDRVIVTAWLMDRKRLGE
jgi:hypothetical protein